MENNQQKKTIVSTISMVKAWAKNRRKTMDKHRAVKTGERHLLREKPVKNQYVIPHKQGWAVQNGEYGRVTYVYTYLNDAVNKARELSKKHHTQLVIKNEKPSFEGT